VTPLSQHFTLEELTFSSTAVRLGIDNTAPSDIVPRLRILANALEAVRMLLGARPIHIDSGYRCPALNKAVGGAPSSAHMQGWAADFLCPDFGLPVQVARALAASMEDAHDGNPGRPFDQIIMEGVWVHISFDPQARRQCLTAHFTPNGVSYTSGIQP
jgi:hypothetical protein